MSGGARRFLHTNLNTPNAAVAGELYTELFGLNVVMSTASDPVDGALYGTPGTPTHSDATFLYDDRGARHVVGLELQEWYEPKVVGTPYDDVTAPGMQALGLSAPDLDALAARAVELGGALIGDVPSALLCHASRTLWLRDRDGVLLEVVGDGGAPSGRMHRLIVSTPDADEALRFYAEVGFSPVAHARLDDASRWLPMVAAGRGADAHLLQLPDDPRFSLLLIAWDDSSAAELAYAEPWHAGLYRCALAVDDVRAEHRRLVEASVPRIDDPTVVPMEGTKVGDLTVCFLRDPCGVTVELVERPLRAQGS